MLRVAIGILGASLAASGVHAQSAPRAVWIDVPYVAQPPDGCGAAALSMVMQYWDDQEHTQPSTAADVNTIQHQLYSRKEHGIEASAMSRYLEQHGFRAFAVNGRWSDLEEHLAKGRPLIVALRPQGQSALHYVVVDGVDPVRGTVTMNDPGLRKFLEEERDTFERDWSATHNWLLLAVPAPAQ